MGSWHVNHTEKEGKKKNPNNGRKSLLQKENQAATRIWNFQNLKLNKPSNPQSLPLEFLLTIWKLLTWASIPSSSNSSIEKVILHETVECKMLPPHSKTLAIGSCSWPN
jgi:hypothetical protein